MIEVTGGGLVFPEGDPGALAERSSVCVEIPRSGLA